MKLREITALACCVAASCVGTKEFTIKTDPPGADIIVNGQQMPGKSPMTLTIKQDKDLGIVAVMPGYEAAAKTVPTSMSLWRAVLWTETDPRARYIEEDDTLLILKPIPTAAEFKPTVLPEYGTEKRGDVPKLPELPSNFMP